MFDGFAGSGGLEYNEYVELLKQHLRNPEEIEMELRVAFGYFDKVRKIDCVGVCVRMNAVMSGGKVLHVT